MGNLTRRNFIKVTAVASASLSPVAALLADYLGFGLAEVEDALLGNVEENPHFHLIDNNLLNLHFYFLNIKKKKQELTPRDPAAGSFMIVRLPQQHVSEAGFWDANWKESYNNKPFAFLSGFSYLAFQLWPPDKPRSKKKLQFSLENLLDWNNENNLKLITLLDWLKMQGDNTFRFSDLSRDTTACDKFKADKVWKKNAAETDILKRYALIVSQLFNGNTSKPTSKFVPITFFEVPHEVCLVPLMRKGENGSVVKARFSPNQLLVRPSKKTSTRKYEIWNNTLFYERVKPGDVVGTGPKKQEFVFESPTFRIAGLITDREPPCPASPIACSSTPNQSAKAGDIIPSLLTKLELAYLTQYAAKQLGADRTLKDFDINELNGFFFTGLGVITHLRYDTQKDLPEDIDLIEYEHKITQGRDVFVKVARLGYNSKTGQKYKHVIEGKRRIPTESKGAKEPPPASFLELKQYCECIETEISYEHFADPPQEWNNQRFIAYTASTDQINAPVVTNDCHYRRGPFRSLKITDKKRIPIDCLKYVVQDLEVCGLEGLEWFWVIKEGSRKDGAQNPIKDSDVPIDRYVPCQYEAIDWENAKHAAATPFMFIRKFYVDAVNASVKPIDPNAEGEAYHNYLRGVYDKKNSTRDPLILRKLTYFNGEKLAYTLTPPPPDAKLFKAEEKIPTYDSKTNVLETDYFESYFHIKNTKWPSDPDAGITSFGDKRYVVFPQVLRSRVYLDHIRDITQTKVASVTEYHSHFIKGGFEESFNDGGTRLKNYGKLILKNTEAYVTGAEERVNQTYGTIKSALQQAKDKLGNLAVPDVVPDAISLDASGITLPRDMTRAINNGRATFDELQSKLKALSPRELLRGKVSEILGGIDLVAILDELIPQENSPLFELRKLTDELQKIEQAITGSPVYKEILQEIEDLKRLVETTFNEVNRILSEIKNAQLAINNALQAISSEIPHTDDLDSMVKKLFERFRTRAFEVLLEDTPFNEVRGEINRALANVSEFLAQELVILKSEFQARANELASFLDAVKDDLGNIPPELRTVNGVPIKDYLERSLGQLYNSVITSNFANYQAKSAVLLRTVADDLPITVDGKTVYYKKLKTPSLSMAGYTRPLTAVITWELTDQPAGAEQLFDLRSAAASGYVQLNKKIGDLRTLIAANINSAQSFQRNAANELLRRVKILEDTLIPIQREVEDFQKYHLEPISRDIRQWHDKAEDIRQNIADLGQKEAIKRIQELMLRANSYVDFLRNVDPYFYYVEQERLKKDVQDIQRRFHDVLAELYGPIETFDKCPPPYDDCASVLPAPSSISEAVMQCVCRYECARKILFEYALDPTKNKLLEKYVDEFNKTVKGPLDDIKGRVLVEIENHPTYLKVKEAREAVRKAKELLEEKQKDFQREYAKYLKLVSSQAKEFGEQLITRLQQYLDKLEQQLSQTVDPATIQAVQSKINEARNVYKVLTAIKQQELSYKWSTTNFHDVNLGILTFKKQSEPDTKLTVDVKIITHFSPGRFPPAIEKIDTLALNRLTNFGVGFFNVLTLFFSEASFRAESGRSPHFAIKIKDVKFDGAFSFVQEFEKFMAGKGLILRIEPDRLILGYSLALPSIQTPSFAFFNLSLNFDIRLYFDSRPMRFGFSFARPDLKFGIAAGIYAGFGFFGLVGEPKRGIVEMDAALEAGAWKGISIGPISGEVKLAFGFRYTRNDAGVRLEGYIVAEGRLSVWIIEVSARIYLGVVSENSYVEGQCTVTYSAKLGFIKKSFSGTFRQKIAGAKSNNHDGDGRKLLTYYQKLSAFLPFPINLTSQQLHQGYVDALINAESEMDPEPETSPVSRESWKRFARIM